MKSRHLLALALVFTVLALAVEGQMRIDNSLSTASTTATAGITASTTQTQGQQALTTAINEVDTVANTDDVVTIFGAASGLRATITSHGENRLQIFPASGDNLGYGANVSTFLEEGNSVTFAAHDATNWDLVAATQVPAAMKRPSGSVGVWVWSRSQAWRCHSAAATPRWRPAVTVPNG